MNTLFRVCLEKVCGWAGGVAVGLGVMVSGVPTFAVGTGDVVIQWNGLASGVLVENEALQNPGMASRSMAMMNVAIYDSFAMTKADFGASTFYGHDGSLSGLAATADTDAAAAQAAYTVLSSIYGEQQATLDAFLGTSLESIADGVAKTDGIALGTAIGEAVVAWRAGDGYDSSVQYVPTYEVGHWTPDPVNPGQEAWGPLWGEVQPFALPSVDAYLPVGPAELTSQAYADAFNEVKALGSVGSTVRTAEQTEAGLFWAYDRVGLGTPMVLFNEVLRTIGTQEGNTAKQNAEMFAKATVAMADAGIVAWNSKFEYDFWRPVTGIRDAELDGNAMTEDDDTWTPLGAPDGIDEVGFTPPFPTYLSGHATFGGALFGSLMEFYGTDDIAFTLSSEELAILMGDPALQALYGLNLTDSERAFASLSEAMAENGRSRVYLGIHWNFDDTVGQETGQAIAMSMYHNSFVAAVPEPASVALLTAGLMMLTRRRPKV